MGNPGREDMGLVSQGGAGRFWTRHVCGYFKPVPSWGVSSLGWPSMPAHADARGTRRQQSFALAAAEYMFRGWDMAGLGDELSQVCSLHSGA